MGSKEVKTNEVKFALRLPAKIHSEVQALAESEFRSMNSQITALIHEALTTRKSREAQLDSKTSNRQSTRTMHRDTNALQQLSIDDLTGLESKVPLTPKQQELLDLLVQEDMSYRQITALLGINASTVRDRTSTLLRKLGIESRAELLDRAKAARGARQPSDPAAR